MLAAYGVGTAQAATLTVVSARREVAGATRLADGVYAVGPPEWVEQAQQRIALASTGEAALRDPAGARAPGAARARDAGRGARRVAADHRAAVVRRADRAGRARPGIDAPPAQLSAWGDVVDDLAIVIDCDATDPGSAPAGQAGAPAGRRADPTRRLAATLRAMLATVAEQPTIRALGLPPSLAGARLVARGSWVRAIIAVGPEHLRRVAERAAGLLGEPPAPAAPPGASAPPVPQRGDPPS